MRGYVKPSDISLFTHFSKLHENSSILRIERTYRNPQQLIDCAGAFVQKNQLQLSKTLVSNKFLSVPIHFYPYSYDRKIVVEHIIEDIVHKYGADKEIMFLGRYNRDFQILEQTNLFSRKNEEGLFRCIDFPTIPLRFMTIHRSKGMESDNVVILNFSNEKYGFPSTIADDSLLNLLLGTDDSYPFAEERRLMYVALTRTRNEVFILTPEDNPSVFYYELVDDHNTDEICTDTSYPFTANSSPSGGKSQSPLSGSSFYPPSAYPASFGSNSKLSLTERIDNIIKSSQGPKNNEPGKTQIASGNTTQKVYTIEI